MVKLNVTKLKINKCSNIYKFVAKPAYIIYIYLEIEMLDGKYLGAELITTNEVQ